MAPPDLPPRVLEAAQRAVDWEPPQRAEAFAEDLGRTERLVDGPALGLVTVRLSDLGPVGAYAPAGEPEQAEPDVLCDLKPSEARQLAARLLDLADALDPPLGE